MCEYEMSVTELLERWQEGDCRVADKLFSVIHEELRWRARRYLRQERPGHTLVTDALVNEAFLRLVRQQGNWRSRTHFCAIAASSMRRILVDHARARQRAKRGCGRMAITLDPALVADDGTPGAFLDINRALSKLAESDPALANLIELRYFGGLQLREIAYLQGVSLSKVKRDLRFALGVLHGELKGGGYEKGAADTTP